LPNELLDFPCDLEMQPTVLSPLSLAREVFVNLGRDPDLHAAVGCEFEELVVS
jgi:hypothetical protein